GRDPKWSLNNDELWLLIFFGRTSGQRAGRINMRVEVDAYAHSIDHFPAEPAADQCKKQSNNSQTGGKRCRRIGIGPAQPPTDGKKDNHDVHHPGMPETDRFRACTAIERPPVSKAEYGGNESAKHADRNQPAGDVAPTGDASH